VAAFRANKFTFHKESKKQCSSITCSGREVGLFGQPVPYVLQICFQSVRVLIQLLTSYCFKVGTQWADRHVVLSDLAAVPNGSSDKILYNYDAVQNSNKND
jgi:hypothetical protein